MRRDNTGAYIEYDRDNLGNITARRVKNSGGTTLLSQTATFDELRRLLTFVGAASQTWTHGYDKTDNRVSVTDPRSNVHQWSFESLNRLISETDEGAEIDARQLDIMSTWQRARSRQHSVLGDFDVPKLHQDLRYTANFDDILIDEPDMWRQRASSFFQTIGDHALQRRSFLRRIAPMMSE